MEYRLAGCTIAAFDDWISDQYLAVPRPQQYRALSWTVIYRYTMPILTHGLLAGRRTLHIYSRSPPKARMILPKQTGTPPNATTLGDSPCSPWHIQRIGYTLPTLGSGGWVFSRSIDLGCGVRLERSDRSPFDGEWNDKGILWGQRLNGIK